ncbi:MAG: tRNA (N6-isopentenyl adenosine(37)-C2)-methylthiotransferase MiaB [Sphingobacteriia bacterium]|nr:tRNA (N6-isopentenyl adenosine(37)-C2)-methylthiotransferase MiaB [Sphingobacteriia bacterium]
MSHLLPNVFTPGNLNNSPQLNEELQGSAYVQPDKQIQATTKKAYIETYGCQMNFSDTEIIAAQLAEIGFGFTPSENNADLVLLNTCAIRENAETKIWNRLKQLKVTKKSKPGLMVGVMGCMAERLKTKLLDQEQLVDLVVGPDAYRDIARLVEEVESGQKAVNVLLSREETYSDIAPIRLNTNGITAFISIMRGCDNMCSFCVVPFTRGRERSRDYQSIVQEAEDLFNQGYKEITLLGQNVDSYNFENCTFANLLEKVALINPLLRIRFSTSHPKDITDEVLFTMAKYPNICKFIHLPAQSGNSRILELMNRGYTREWYLNKINRIREIMPNCSISTDIITGFCSETIDEHQDTLSLMETVAYDSAFMFYYSERPGTLAARKYPDDIPESEKKRRLSEVIEVQQKLALNSNLKDIGKTFEILIEGNSKRSEKDWCGRNSQNKMVVFPKDNYPLKPGDYVTVLINQASTATLLGEIIS